MRLPFVKGYRPTALEHVEMALLFIALLMHFATWVSVKYKGEELFTFIPFSTLGSVFTILTFVVFLLAIVMKFAGRFSGMTLLAVVQMSVLIWGSTMAAKKVENMVNMYSGFHSTLSVLTSQSSESSQALSVGGLNMLVGCLTFVMALCMVASWGVSMYRLSRLRRQKLRNSYLIGMAGYFIVAVLALLVAITFVDSLKNGHGAYRINDVLGELSSVYTIGVCAIAFLVMLFMLIVNVTVWLICELFCSDNRKLMMTLSLIGAVFFFIFFAGATMEKSELALSLPSSFDDIFLMLGKYGEAWVALTLAQAWTITVAVTFVLRAIFFGRPQTEKEKEEETGAATEEESGAAEDAEQETEGNAVDQVVEPIYEETNEENPLRKYYIGGGVVAVILLVSAFLLFKSCGGSHLMNVEEPQWSKFVVANADNVTLYKEADNNSPKLRYATENMESDMVQMMFCWSDEKEKRGFTVSDYSFSKDDVSPVLEETEGWYKVQMNDYQAGRIEAWVEKYQCREVKPEPITKDVLDRFGQTGWNRYHLVTEGKLKDLVVHSEFQEMDGYNFEMGVLVNGCLICPQQLTVCLLEQQGDASYQFGKEEIGYVLRFAEEQKMKENDMSFFDPQKLTTEQIQTVYDAITYEKPIEETVYYYFPEVSDERLFQFVYDMSNVKSENSRPVGDSDEDDLITDYRVLEMNGEWELQAVLDMKTEKTGITSSYEMELLSICDMDGDGNKEALVVEHSGGSAGEMPPSIVYYDQEAKKYKMTESVGMANVIPVVEEVDGKTTILFRRGLHWERYVFEQNTVRQTESENKDMGNVLRKWTRVGLFPDLESVSEQEVSFDLDEDGVPETIHIAHDNSHASNFGKEMHVSRFEWGNGTPDNSPSIQGESLAVLESRHNGVHDLLVDDAGLYRWDGDKYEPWMWNGKELIVVDN